MKRNLIITAALLASLTATAQTEVTVGVMRGKDYGVTYMLPKTEIEMVLEITRHTYTPGPFCQYADRYLQERNVSTEPEVRWTLDNIRMQTIGLPDKERVYFVKLKDKTVAPLMELTEDGIVRSINLPFSGTKPRQPETPAETPEKTLPDPNRFLTEEILLATSTAKKAELVAKEIYYMRESRNALLRGEADNTPKDGMQLKLMLDNMELQEQALTEMFTGHTTEKSETVRLSVTPEEMKDKVVFRFSRKLGVLDKDDLAGEPYCLSITNLNTPTLPAVEEENGKKKEELEGVAYNMPGRARITLTQGNKTLLEAEMPVTQFGTVEYLAPILFNKNSTTTVLFDTTTGGLIKVDRQ
ncbi:MAG TPA: DUF4831 family protein [Candidatus Bacteroides merdigallinarum]|uniref:DUF4831 family protein n=1 Tax=Candidatus Bacteroides merdigallinarum TaxID=2838473 RepID=A0A9D2EAM0_9BACE|nr:DUF4831 family protein [Candidatus Bacteroides merdigallinarum]